MSARAAIYTRISEDPVARTTGRAVNCETQEADCRTKAAQIGAEVVAVYSDQDLTAADPNVKRLDFERTLEDVLAGEWEILLVYNQDRYVRMSADIERVIASFKVAGAQLVPCIGTTDFESPEGRLYARFNTLLGSYEVEKVKLRTQRKMRALAEKGLRHGGGGYGYRRALTETGDKTLEIDEDEALVIKEAAARVIAGETLDGIARDFNARELSTRTGHPWRGSLVRRILVAPRTGGRRLYQGQDFGEAVWPAILDADTYTTVRQILTDPGRMHTKHGPAKLLTGVITCSRCRLTMNSKYDKGSRRYYCRHCNRRVILAEGLEHYIGELLFEALDSDWLAQAVQSQQAADGTGEIRATIERKTRQRKQLMRDYTNDRISDEEWEVAKAELDSQLKRLRAGLDERRSSSAITEWVGRGEALRAVWGDEERSPVVWKRQLIASAFKEILIGPGQLGPNTFDKRRVSWEWRV